MSDAEHGHPGKEGKPSVAGVGGKGGEGGQGGKGNPEGEGGSGGSGGSGGAGAEGRNLFSQHMHQPLSPWKEFVWSAGATSAVLLLVIYLAQGGSW